jgi:ubiquinone/menaquinone biosynthesis C-methylase UbiE/uncharacterized protein YbaR (Trm112 family)
MIDNYLLSIIACPVCRGDLNQINNRLICSSCSQQFETDDGIPVLLPPETYKDIMHVLPAWHHIWKETPMHDPSHVDKEEDIVSAYNHVKPLWDKHGTENFLEAGCGSGRMLYLLARTGVRVIGLDISAEALKFSRRFLTEIADIKNCHFVCGDMRFLPFKDNSIGMIYGGGSIEHFEETQRSVSELHRILKNNGVLSLTYPYISIATLTYRQMYGNIPELPVIKQIAKFIHINVLKKKLMHFGYEKSFTIGKMESFFKKAGFSKRNINSDLFDTYLQIGVFKNPAIKELLRKISRNKLFWPMVYTNGIKK